MFDLFRHYMDRSRCNGTSGCIYTFFTRWVRYGYKIPPQDYLNIVRLWKWMCELWCTSWVLMFLCELRACLVQKFYLIIYYQRHLITLFIVWFGCYVINWRGIRYPAFKTTMPPTFWHYVIHCVLQPLHAQLFVRPLSPETKQKRKYCNVTDCSGKRLHWHYHPKFGSNSTSTVINLTH